MARRRNSIAHRFARLKGLPPEEKSLMQRIGNLMDSALNNRQASNPYESSQSRMNRLVYPPTGLLSQEGISSVKLIWNATDSDELLRYEIMFTNLTTGVTETKTAFTHKIIYKGPTGSYVARVKSVGRDGSSSPIQQIAFVIDSDVMLLEGAKNGATELGTLVQDNIKLYENYSVYVWGSVVLDKYTLDTNNDIIFRLWRADRADATFGEAYLVESIQLYSATESGASLDGTARAGLITRPTAARQGSFETTQSVMFSPQAVDAADVNKTVTYFLQATNRNTEYDEVCLSLVLWAGADGVGTAIPGQVDDPEPPYVFPYFTSFHMQGAPNGAYQVNYPYDTRSWCANIENGYSLIGNKWTVAMWVRFDMLENEVMGSASSDNNPEGGDQIFLTRGPVGSDYTPNSWQFEARGTLEQAGGDPPARHWITIRLWDRFAGDAGGNPISGENVRKVEFWANCYNGRALEKSALFPYGDAQSGAGANEHEAWYFIVVCFEGGDFTGPVPKCRVYMNTGTDPFTLEPIMQLLSPTTDETKDPITQDDRNFISYQPEAFEDGPEHTYWNGIYNGDLRRGPWTSAGMQYHRLGIWNRAIDVLQTGGHAINEIAALYNEGRGWAVDWKRNTVAYANSAFPELDYRSSENLVHLNHFGAVEEPFATKQAGRDSGWHLPDWQGALNWTYDRWEQGYEYHDITPGPNYHKRLIEGTYYDNLPQSWNRGTDIYDVLSPDGTNRTTAYSFAYPGQGLSGSGTFAHNDRDLNLDYDDWVAAGSEPFTLNRISGPYSPGYHPDDPDRPITGGTG